MGLEEWAIKFIVWNGHSAASETAKLATSIVLYYKQFSVIIDKFITIKYIRPNESIRRDRVSHICRVV